MSILCLLLFSQQPETDVHDIVLFSNFESALFEHCFVTYQVFNLKFFDSWLLLIKHLSPDLQCFLILFYFIADHLDESFIILILHLDDSTGCLKQLKTKVRASFT